MANVEFLFLDRPTVEALLPDTPTLLDIVESGLAAHGRREVVLPPKSHLQLDDRYNGHFNILAGFVAPGEMAGVKVVGDYVKNYRHGLPSEIALLTLYDPRTGSPRALLDATVLTWLRTGAVTGIGAKHLARRDTRILAHVGARGTAFGNIAAIASQFALQEVRIASKRRETRVQLAREVEAKLGLAARAVESIEEACRDADIVVEATRLERPAVLIEDRWLKPGSLLVTYGWVMAVDPRAVATVEKRVVDDWQQCKKGGALHPLIESGALRDEHIHAEIGEIVAGAKPGRADPAERILFWHRGFAISDIVLGSWILAEAERKGVGQPLALWRDREE
jgi:ornithine cyclodeaminase/alanine dehydrogenase-like protein (mu-crystallin family)